MKIRKNILFLKNSYYELTSKGSVILNDHKYYYSKIIINFFKKICIKSTKYEPKKYELKEIRQEQQQLRNYLINNKSNVCIICDKKLPLSLLETAHLKPRCILNNNELNDNNDLVAVAKLSKPLKKNFTKEMLVRVKLDF